MHVRCGNKIMSCGISTLVPKNANRSSGLDPGESPVLNIASLLEALVHKKPIIMKTSARPFFYDKTHTSRTTMTIALKLGGALDGHRCLSSLTNCSAWFVILGGATNCVTNTSKAMGVVSKEEIRTPLLNTGLPKGVILWQRSTRST